MSASIAIIGCGNIGSRHLQSVSGLPFETKIDIVEPNVTACTLAKERLKEVQHGSNDNISWHQSIDKIKDSDLVVVSTPSTGRVDLINQLLKLGNRRFLIEKMVCQSQDEYDLLLSEMQKHQVKGWVNTNRRYFKTYKLIKNAFKDASDLSLSVIGANPRLGTSSIHYIDLFCWLLSDYEINLNGELLEIELFPNKRGSHLKEFAGTVVGSLKNKSTLTITFVPDQEPPSIVSLVGNNNAIVIDETNEKIDDPANQLKGQNEFKFEHTSELTKVIAQDILKYDSCMLPTIQELYRPHCELFRIFNNHIKTHE